MAQLIRTAGWLPGFRWLPLTILSPSGYYDHHFLYHVLLAPFAWGDPSTPSGAAALALGGKLASILFTSLTGFRSDIPNLMRCADIGVLCSETESAPLTLLEGMSTGLPMISTKVGGVPEIIQDGKNGLLIPSKHPEELAEAILQLYKDQKLRRRLGENARKTVLEKYTAEKVVNQYLETFEAVMPRG